MFLISGINSSQTEQSTVTSIATDYIQQAKGIKQLVIDPAIKAIDWVDLFKECFSEVAKEYKMILGGFGTFIVGMEDLHKQVVILRANDFGSPKFNIAMMRGAAKVGVLALAQLGLIGIVYGIAVPKILVLSISTLLLALAIATHFYKKIALPKK